MVCDQIAEMRAGAGSKSISGTSNGVRMAKKRTLIAGLLIAHATLLLISSRLQFPTRNEVAHVPAGLVCWEGNYSLYSVNPPLWKMLATLPTHFLNPNLSGIRLPHWPGERPEWQDAHAFAVSNAPHYFTLIWSARLAGICWSVIGGWIIYRWAQELYGGQAGLLALALWCFGPSILAHAPLVTPDVPAAVAALGATYIFRHYLRHGTWGRAAAAGVLLGVAQLTKFTLLLLYAVWPVLFLLYALDQGNRAFRLVPLRTRFLQAAAILALSLLMVNLSYEFDGTFQPLGEFQFVSRTFTGKRPVEQHADTPAGNRFSGTLLGRLPIPVPADFLIGLDVQRRDFEGRLSQSYLRGEWREYGWWYYYLYALAVKVPLGTWALVLWGIALTALWPRCRPVCAEELTLWLPAIVTLVLVSSQTGFSHHFRYVLPALPFVCVATGKLGQFLNCNHWKAGTIVAALLVATVTSSLRVYPHSLSYFNELAGGPDCGAEHLVDSNIDWGQDLFFFRAWEDRHPEARPLGLAYFNYIDYRVIGTKYDEVAPDPGPGPATLVESTQVGPHPGWFGVDIYSLKEGPYKYFADFTPVDKAGYSIFIYHISPAEANAARRQRGLSPLKEAERP
jgi:4-amino-4-deoxy-L-arabinose transferase-like glycosyltransferase